MEEYIFNPVIHLKDKKMPLRDATLIQLAQKRRLYYKICRECGSRNAPTAEKCRKCRSYNLRWKKREIKR